MQDCTDRLVALLAVLALSSAPLPARAQGVAASDPDVNAQLTISVRYAGQAFATTLMFPSMDGCKRAAAPLLAAHDMGPSDRSTATCTAQDGSVPYRWDCRWTAKDMAFKDETAILDGAEKQALLCSVRIGR